ncbi:hypothetical protein NLJ89_g4162 [Agrocybe chaxingu]|uniref:F-box domain-containing protein n=1 Tax=Agrocybe chaxingu TaxID=84603 RepID=A0A9W8K3U3_9AGAR|nr:hypothetical protein NLJ89_g4162 [Agrocybe chaxingu]
MVAQIGLLPLEELQMNLERFSDFPSLPPPDDSRRGYFHDSKHATIFVRSPNVLLDLIEQWNATKLQSLTVNHPRRSFIWNFEDIFKFLAEYLLSATLRSLVFRTVPPDDSNVPYNQNTSEPGGLNIDVGRQVTLKDADLVAIVSACPLLEDFGVYERVLQHALVNPGEMHACLQVPELLFNIFQYCHDNDEAEADIAPPEERSLPALARTCRYFLEPALDVHWHTISSLGPLLFLLPDDIVKLERARNDIFTPDSILHIDRKIQKSEFSRWMYYSPRVKAIDTRYVGGALQYTQIPCYIYDILLSLDDKGKRLLPNLRDITVEILCFTSNRSFFSLLFNQSIRRIAIVDGSRVSRNDFDYEPIWTGLAALLTEKNVGGLKRLDLRSFQLSDASMVAQIGLLQLEELQINLERLDSLDPPLPPPDNRREGYFSSLKRATIFARSPDTLLDLIRQWNATELQSLTVDRPERSVTWNLEEIFKILGEHLPSTTLRSLVFLTRPAVQHSPYNRNTSDLTCGTMSTLFPLKNLKTLSLSTGGRVAFKDADLIAFAYTWPLLETFEAYERELIVESEISSRGVLSFVAALPRLDHLTLRFNALSHSVSLDDIPALGHLRSLDVCLSSADNPDVIAQFIRQAFPSLAQFVFGLRYLDGDPGASLRNSYVSPQEDHRGKEYYNCWKDVLVLLEPSEEIPSL